MSTCLIEKLLKETSNLFLSLLMVQNLYGIVQHKYSKYSKAGYSRDYNEKL